MSILCRIATLALFALSWSISLAVPPQRGDAAPDINLGSGLDGNPLKVADFNGEVVVVSFWASWCGPCRKELPMLDALQRVAEQKKLGLQVIAINIEERDQFRKIAPKLGAMHAKLVNERNRRSADAYGVKAIPHMIIIGRDGRIAQTHVGYGEREIDHILAQINALLANAPAGS